MNILLLTASVNAKLASPIYTNLIDTNERMEQYLSTLKRYIIESNFDTFVFCENTGYIIPKDYLVELAWKNKKSIEFLTFISDVESVKKFGKGYGEGQCIEYALKNSIYLQKELVCFFKVTGRLFIENINEIIRENRNRKNCYLTDGINSKSVKTVFFKTQVSFFNRNLLDVYKNVNDSENKFLEYIYFECLINEKVKGISPYPFISGNSGSTGNPYTLIDKYKKISYLNYLGFYSLNKLYYFTKKYTMQVIKSCKKSNYTFMLYIILNLTTQVVKI